MIWIDGHLVNGQFESFDREPRPRAEAENEREDPIPNVQATCVCLAHDDPFPIFTGPTTPCTDDTPSPLAAVRRAGARHMDRHRLTLRQQLRRHHLRSHESVERRRHAHRHGHADGDAPSPPDHVIGRTHR